MSTIRAVAYGMVSVCAAAVLACGGQDTGSSAGAGAGAGAAAPPPAAVAPHAAITSPAEGDSVSGDSLKVTMSITGARLVPAKDATTPRAPLEGHLHLFIDKAVTPPNAPIPAGDPAMVHLGAAQTEWVITKLAKGPHRLIVVFAFSDHSPDIAVAMDTVNVIVR